MKKEEKDEYDKTYGLFKFKRPLPSEIESAMGLVGESILFKKLISADYERFYDPIKIPEEGDWLMTHKEYGQTYNEYIQKDCFPVDPNHNVIYIHRFSSNDDLIKGELFHNVIILLEAFFTGMKVYLIDEGNSNYINNNNENNIENSNENNNENNIENNNENNIENNNNNENNNENNLENNNNQNNDNNDNKQSNESNEKIPINADQLLEKLKLEMPEDAYCLFGIIDNDIYTETLLPNGKRLIKATYGKRSVPDRVSIFSLARFDPFFNFNGKIKNLSKEQKHKISLILLKRVCSAITREICYMFGMKNCTFMSCCMNGTNVAEFDNKQIELCPICLRKLITNIRANGEDIKTYRVKKPLIVYNRFVRMRDALENFSGLYENELKWFDARIEFLKTLI
jgi:predicted Zn-dependent protease